MKTKYQKLSKQNVFNYKNLIIRHIMKIGNVLLCRHVFKELEDKNVPDYPDEVFAIPDNLPLTD